MKKNLLISATSLLLSLVACSYQHSSSNNNTSNSANGEYPVPAAGKLVAADSMPVTDDPLNHFKYTVKVRATPNSKYGTYEVDAKWGDNIATDGFTMPRGGEHLRPLIRKGADRYTYIIGFHYGNDKTFYDYYQVSARKGQIEMKYIKAYSFK